LTERQHLLYLIIDPFHACSRLLVWEDISSDFQLLVHYLKLHETLNSLWPRIPVVAFNDHSDRHVEFVTCAAGGVEGINIRTPSYVICCLVKDYYQARKTITKLYVVTSGRVSWNFKSIQHKPNPFLVLRHGTSLTSYPSHQIRHPLVFLVLRHGTSLTSYPSDQNRHSLVSSITQVDRYIKITWAPAPLIQQKILGDSNCLSRRCWWWLRLIEIKFGYILFMC